jgi:hypothetical protein
VPGGLLVRTVLAEDPERPLGGAEVFFVAPEVKEQLGGWRRWVVDPLAVAREGGRRFRTDARGLVRVPREDFDAILAVSHERVGGVRGAGQGDQEEALVVPMAPPAPLRARVVDERGEGVGEIRLALNWSAGSGQDAEHSLGVLSSEEDSGRVLYPNPLLSLGLQDIRTDDGTFTLSATLPAAEVREVTLTRENAFDREHTLRVPATGTLRLRFLGPDGVPLEDGEGSITLLLTETRKEAEDPEARQENPSRLDARREWQAGAPLEIPGLRTGRWIQVRARIGDLPAPILVLRGPESPGEVVEASVTFAHHQPRYTFRVIDTTGSLVPDTPLEIWVTRGQPESSRSYCIKRVTDGDGRFSFLNRTLLGGVKGSLRISVREDVPALPAVLARKGETPVEPRGAGVLFDDARARTGEDAGVLILRPLPLDLAGVVVDESGNPVAGATVSAIARGDTHTDAEGRFWFLAQDEAPDEQSLCVTAPGFLAPWLEGVKSGSLDLRVVMRRPLDLRLCVLTRPGVARHLILGLTSTEAGPSGILSRDPRSKDDGRSFFLARGIAPGSYVLQVALHGRQVIREIKGLRLAPGAPLDPRLDPLDLRTDFRLVRLQVRGPAGERPDGTLSWQDPIDALSIAGGTVYCLMQHTIEKGLAEVALPAQRFPRATLHVPGFQPKILGELIGDRTVLLEYPQ